MTDYGLSECVNGVNSCHNIRTSYSLRQHHNIDHGYVTEGYKTSQNTPGVNVPGHYFESSPNFRLV